MGFEFGLRLGMGMGMYLLMVWVGDGIVVGSRVGMDGYWDGVGVKLILRIDGGLRVGLGLGLWVGLELVGLKVGMVSFGVRDACLVSVWGKDSGGSWGGGGDELEMWLGWGQARGWR